MDEIAVKVEHVSKDFVLPHERNTSIKQAFVNPFKSSMHKNTTKQHALKDVSFEIKRGEFFGIVGRNGSGKSTLLKMIAGIYQPTKGRVSVHGKLVPFIELGVGFNPELTGRENVYLNGALLGFSRNEVSAMYEDIVAFAELKEFMDQKLKNYSSGMQVRLAFSMAIRADADVLLIDEVLAVGDADFQRKCFEYFKDLKKRHKTVVFVSHDMNAIQDYCDRALLIEGHKALRLDHPGVIAQDYIRLFESEKPKQSRSASKSERWGSRRASILNLSCSVRNDSVSIEYDVVAKDDLEEIVAGFRIRNASGEAIIGTNTKREKQPIKEINKGQIIHVSWSFPNILSTDKYYVDPALVESDEITVLDWWNEAAVFHINKRQGFSFIVDPEIDLKLSKK